ncbi:MAG: endo-1,4-beta-xylanase [Oscillospiraceae bacterium]|nr:endo-1,4-beta-xylanase [Oscillospiraceae bacterium]
MRLSRAAAFLTAFTVFSGMFTYFPMNASAEEAVHNDFETSYGGWHGSDTSVELSRITGTSCDDSFMTVSSRTSPSDGVCSEKGFYLEGGVRYTYSVSVRSEYAERFELTLECEDMTDGSVTHKTLVSENVPAGKWTTLCASYTAPENSGTFRMKITTGSTNDFSFDDVSVRYIKQNGTVYAEESEKGLKDEFADYFRVGNILNNGTVRTDIITANILKNFNSITCENEMKPDSTLVQKKCSGTEVGVSFIKAAAIMDFCDENDIPMRAHTLVWHSQTPVWFFKEDFKAGGDWVEPEVMDARMDSYMKNFFAAIETQYPELEIYAVDVCNECISDDAAKTKDSDGAREPAGGSAKGSASPWVAVYGDNSFVEKAFATARKYAPEGCKLFYNDYNEYWDHKRDCIYRMCSSLYEKGLLDGVGMQSHVNANVRGFSGIANIRAAMEKYLSIGCEVQITELDVTCEDGKFTAEQQADKFSQIFRNAMELNDLARANNTPGRITAVCIWGPNDKNSWLGSKNAGVLFDENNDPKPAYTALTSLIDVSEWGDGSRPFAEAKGFAALGDTFFERLFKLFELFAKGVLWDLLFS